MKVLTYTSCRKYFARCNEIDDSIAVKNCQMERIKAYEIIYKYI